MRADETASSNWNDGHLGQRQILLDGAVSLFPGYFALAIATGLILVACHFMELRPVALMLVVINWIS